MTPQTPPTPAAPATKKKAARDWQCNECGKRMTLKAAERAMYGADGCPKCGGADIDLAETVRRAEDDAAYLRRQSPHTCDPAKVQAALAALWGAK